MQSTAAAAVHVGRCSTDTLPCWKVRRPQRRIWMATVPKFRCPRQSIARSQWALLMSVCLSVCLCVGLVGWRVATHGNVHVSHARLSHSTRRPLHAHLLLGGRAPLQTAAGLLLRLHGTTSADAASDETVSRSLPADSAQVLVSLSLRVHARTQQSTAVGWRRPASSPRVSADERPSWTVSARAHVRPRSKVSGKHFLLHIYFVHPESKNMPLTEFLL